MNDYTGQAWPVNNGSDLREDQLDWPHRWRNPRHVTVPDLFGNRVPDEAIARVWQVMASTPRHTFQIATSDAARMRDWVSCCAKWDGYVTHNGQPVSSYGGAGIIVGYPDAPRKRPGWDDRGPRGGKLRRKPSPPAYGWPLPNVRLGAQIRNQDDADISVPALLDTPAAIRWVFVELTSPVGLEMCIWAPLWMKGFPGTHNALTGEWWPAVGNAAEEYEDRITDLPRLDWVVVRGATGRDARPAHPAWVRQLRDRCHGAGVPFCFTGWGEWGPAPWRIDREPGESDGAYKARAEAKCATHSLLLRCGRLDTGPVEAAHRAWSLERTAIPPEQAALRRWGTRRSGRLLDGQLWDQRPAVKAHVLRAGGVDANSAWPGTKETSMSMAQSRMTRPPRHPARMIGKHFAPGSAGPGARRTAIPGTTQFVETSTRQDIARRRHR